MASRGRRDRGGGDGDLALCSAAAAVLHFFSGAVFIGLWWFYPKEDGGRRDLVYPLYTGYSFWNATAPNVASATGCAAPRSIIFSERMSVSPAWRDAGIDLSLHWLVTSFFLLSCLFQAGAAGLFYAPSPFVHTALVKFIEYFFSASVMIVAIGLQLGIFNAHVLLLLAALTAATMACGAVVELHMAPGEPKRGSATTPLLCAAKNRSCRPSAAEEQVAALRRRARLGAWLAHFTGWFMQVAVFFVLLDQFFRAQAKCDEDSPSAPLFVWFIVFFELALFSSFGLVQFSQLCGGVGPRGAEVCYIVLSFVSKSLLGWLVYTGNFAG